MIASILADAVLILHLLFIVFALFGGLFVLKYRWVVWLHLAAAAWAAMISFAGWICPLTPLEVTLRRAAGEEGFSGTFVAHYIAPIIYPQGYTRELAIVAGVVVIVLNIVIYAIVFHQYKKERHH